MFYVHLDLSQPWEASVDNTLHHFISNQSRAHTYQIVLLSFAHCHSLILCNRLLFLTHSLFSTQSSNSSVPIMLLFRLKPHKITFFPRRPPGSTWYWSAHTHPRLTVLVASSSPLILAFPATLNALLFLSLPHTLACQNVVSSCSFHLEHLAPMYHLANVLDFPSLCFLISASHSILSVSSLSRAHSSNTVLFLLSVDHPFLIC